jgi:hypothetical protein
MTMRASAWARLLPAMAVVAACGRAPSGEPAPTATAGAGAGGASATPSIAQAAVSARASTDASVAPKPACAALKVELPEIKHADFDVPVPGLDDPAGTLAPFFRKLARVARGTAKDHVRIAVFGDSNMTADFITGAARRSLQAKLGDAGHGYVALAQPWFWYRHQDVEHEITGTACWDQLTVSTPHVRDGFLGYAGIAADSKCAGGVTWVGTTSAKDAPIGARASRADVFYLKRPGGRAFAVRVDGREVQVVETESATTEPAMLRLDLGGDAAHKIELAPKGPMVRLFGVALERTERPSVVIDSLGVGALNAKQMLEQDEATNAAMMKLRGYDLVIELTGTNVLSLKEYPGWLRKLVARWHAALPEAGVVLMSPPDRAFSDTDDDGTAAVLGEEKQKICAAGACAYWDFRGAMGGKLSVVKFRDRGWAGGDLTHITQPGGGYVGGRIAYALLEGLAKAVERDPALGCE